MGNIEFKISGNSTPFSAKLWNSNCSAIVQEKVVEYSGTCVMFSELVGSTCYHVNVVDNIGSSISSGYVTPIALTPPTLPIKSTTLLGSVSCTGIPNYSQQIISPKCVSFSPSLVNHECVDLHLTLCTYNTSCTLNSISVICNGLLRTSSTNQNGQTTSIINIKAGDNVCYGISSISQYKSGDVLTDINGCSVVRVDVCGCSQLSLTSVLGYGIDATLGSITTQKTELNYPANSTFQEIFVADKYDVIIAATGVVLNQAEVLITALPYGWEIDTISEQWIDVRFLSSSSGTNPIQIIGVRNFLSEVRIGYVILRQLQFGITLRIDVTQLGDPRGPVQAALLSTDVTQLNYTYNQTTNQTVIVTSTLYGWGVFSISESYIIATPMGGTVGTTLFNLRFSGSNIGLAERSATVTLRQLTTNQTVVITLIQGTNFVPFS